MAFDAVVAGDQPDGVAACLEHIHRDGFVLIDGVPGTAEALASFSTRVNAPERQVRFDLRPGTLVVFDNWRLLHGREAFTGQRRLCGAYTSHDVFERRLQEVRTG